MSGYPHFSLWIPVVLAKIYFLRVVLAWPKNPGGGGLAPLFWVKKEEMTDGRKSRLGKSIKAGLPP